MLIVRKPRERFRDAAHGTSQPMTIEISGAPNIRIRPNPSVKVWPNIRFGRTILHCLDRIFGSNKPNIWLPVFGGSAEPY